MDSDCTFPSSRKTIVHLCYHASGNGSVEARALFDAQEQMKQGHRVVLVSDFFAGTHPGSLEIAAGRRSVPGRFPEPLREIARMLQVRAQLNRLLQKVQPDTIVFHSGSLSWAAIPAARKVRAKSIYVVHALTAERIASSGSPFGPLRTRFYLAADEFGLRNADRIIPVSKYMGKFAQHSGVDPRNIFVVPNVFDPSRLDLSTSHDRTIDLVFAGRLAHEKGAEILLEALRGLSPELSVALIGDGPKRQSLQEMARSLPMNVTFHGWLPRAQLLEMLSRAKLAVVPSRSEPQGVVVLEALASGTPVVGAATGGIPEMILPGQNGWLFPSGDAAALRTVLRQALDSNEQLEVMRPVCRSSIDAFTPAAVRAAMARAYL